mmetsp:Transcript_19411/g.50473  ORF Transcript_19411/g.50473 Transcript_19411/m.50473 type:complete len:131 (+) Transcript_19411:60-452(+)
MADADLDLAALRKERLAAMQAQAGDGAAAAAQQEQQKAAQAEMKNGMLSALLDQAARARLNSIAVVKPKKAEMVEGIIINMARSGQLQGKVSESMLIRLIEQVNEKSGATKKTTIKFNRRTFDDDDDSDD